MFYFTVSSPCLTHAPQSPATEQIVGSIAAATSEDVDLAVKAARAAFKGWAHTPAKDRAVVLKKIAEGLKNAKKELAKLESLDAGKASFVTAPGILLTLVHSQPLSECEWDMDDAAFCFEARCQLVSAGVCG